MTKISLPLLAVLAALLATGCASTPSTCNTDVGYRKAAAIPPIQPAEGLKLPESTAALKVPDLTPAAVAAAKQPMPKKGKGTACLDYPPEIVATP